jgi:hypothetical protein
MHKHTHTCVRACSAAFAPLHCALCTGPIYIYRSFCSYIYIHTHTHIHTHITHAHIHAYIHVNIYICTMCVCVSIYLSICIYTHTHTYIYIFASFSSLQKALSGEAAYSHNLLKSSPGVPLLCVESQETDDVALCMMM